MKFQGFFEDRICKPDQKRLENHVSDIALFSFLVLSCLTFGNGVDIDNMNVYDFTAENFSQLTIKYSTS